MKEVENQSISNRKSRKIWSPMLGDHHDTLVKPGSTDHTKFYILSYVTLSSFYCT